MKLIPVRFIEKSATMQPNKAPIPHVPRIYRFTATALGASMWFFVCPTAIRPRETGLTS